MYLRVREKGWEMSGNISTVQIMVNRIPQFESFLTRFACCGIHTNKTFMTQRSKALFVRLSLHRFLFIK